MSAVLFPTSLDELAEAVRSCPRVLPVGAQTKPALSRCAATKLSLTGLRGLVEYDPSEFTFTAFAGTPVREIEALLAERGQHLPFDPMLGDAGATLGGTVASGLSGPGRLRFGGIRDFILGVRFVDGAGRLLRLGGKVVKNAAGFDVPKFLVGSLGRFGVLAEITFKVFPRPEATRTLALPVDGVEHAVRLLEAMSVNRWELRALDLLPDQRTLLARLGGPAAALDSLSAEILGRWKGTVLEDSAAAVQWRELSEFAWSHPGGPLIKVPTSLGTLVPLHRALGGIAGARIHCSGGGQVAYLSLPGSVDHGAVGEAFVRLGTVGLTLRGEGRLWWGQRPRADVEAAVRRAFDPENRFPGLDD